MKLFGKVVIILLLIIILIAAATTWQYVDPAQKRTTASPYNFADTLANRHYDLDSLKAIIGSNKGLPTGFEVAAAIAYSAFPELKEVEVKMILTEDGAPMESTPDIWSLFDPTKKRRYYILLNDAQHTYFDPILLRALPFDAQVGILAHELGHIVYYENLNLLQLGKWGIKYLRDDEFRAIHERTTDLMPVYHGLGSQIYQYAYFVRHDPSCVDFYAQGKDFMDRYYLTDKELLEVIDR